MTARHDQLESTIYRAVQEILNRGLNDPRVRGLISVTKVDLSPDLAQANIWVSVHPAEHAELTMHGLRSARKYVQSRLARTVRARRLPKIAFRYDKSIHRAAEILAVVNRAAEDSGRAGSTQTEDEPPSEVADS